MKIIVKAISTEDLAIAFTVLQQLTYLQAQQIRFPCGASPVRFETCSKCLVSNYKFMNSGYTVFII